MTKQSNKSVERFEEFIEIMNLAKDRIWAWQEFSFDKNLAEETEKVGEDYFEENKAEVLTKTLWRVLPVNPEHLKKFSQYLFKKDNPSELDEYEIHDARYSYEAFYENTQTVIKITKNLAILRETGRLPEQGGIETIIDSRRAIGVFKVKGVKDRQKIKTEVKYEMKGDIFTDNPNLARLRSCPTCRIYFLAKRTDAVYCSIKCGNSARQKAWLENEENYEKHLQDKRKRYRNE